jgi:hypothetical protein
MDMPKTATKPPPNDQYETDFYAWTQEQARLLRERRWSDLDLDNLVDEVESVGKSDKKISARWPRHELDRNHLRAARAARTTSEGQSEPEGVLSAGGRKFLPGSAPARRQGNRNRICAFS